MWENPFNIKQQQYISFKNCAVIVFWSKNPAHIIPFLSEIEDMGIQYYFQYTLNDYEQEGLEPRVPKLSQRLATCKKLAERIGRHRIIWRFDPIILSDVLTVDAIVQKIQRIAREIAPYTEKLVFSYLDLYKKTQRALTKLANTFRPPSPEEMYQLAYGIADINTRLHSPLQLATCAEEIALSSLGIAKNKCVDDALILRLCPDLPHVLRSPAKDRGQRALCGCAPSKDIGSYNTCMHLCAYCYANHSANAVIARMHVMNPSRGHTI